LLVRARNCLERGCELWRSLCAEWSGAAPQLQHAKARTYQSPPKCKNVQELWSKLPAWERLGEEVALSGLAVPPWLACSALEQLLPPQLRDSMVQRDELKTFAQRLAWVKTQMEHARGIAQATAYAPGAGKDANGDVHMYSVDGPPGIASDTVEGLSWALAESYQTGDWDLAEQLQNTIYALKGSKGGGQRKGLGKGKSGKGGAPKGGASGAEQFQGACNHCGIWGHRKQDCRRFDADMAKKGKGGSKGKAGGKGGPKGGKGPMGDPLAEVAADDDWAGEIGADAAAAELGEWDFSGGDLCSVQAWPAPTAAEVKTTGKIILPWVRLAKPQTQSEAKKAAKMTLPWTPTLKNSFSMLSSLTEYAEEPPCAARAARAAAAAARTACAPHDWGGTCCSSQRRSARAARAADAAEALQQHRQQRLQHEQQQQQRATKAMKQRQQQLSLLTDDSECLCAVSGEMRGGRVIEAVVDSGAVHSVTPPGCFPGPMVPSPWSAAGRGYRAANGTGSASCPSSSPPRKGTSALSHSKWPRSNSRCSAWPTSRRPATASSSATQVGASSTSPPGALSPWSAAAAFTS
jgi:hypothetical protein